MNEYVIPGIKWFYAHLSDFGSLASIIGLVITVCVWFGIRAIRKHYLFKIRVPQLLWKLDKLASDLNACITTVKVFNDNRTSVQVFLAESDVVLAHLNSYSLTRDTRKRIARVRSTTKKHSKSMSRTMHSDVCNDFADIRAVSEDIKNHVANANWSDK